MAGGRLPGPLCNSESAWFDPCRQRGLSGSGARPECLGLSLGSPAYVSAAAAALDFSFWQCRRPLLGISEQDYQDAAARLQVEVDVVKALAQVETTGKAFDMLGRPSMRFERHQFHRHTGGKYDLAQPALANTTAGGHSEFSAQYERLEQAYRLDPEAALKSAAWGRFQIMGSNHAAAGFASVHGFVLAMARAESEQLKAFAHFVASDAKRVKALREGNGATSDVKVAPLERRPVAI